MIGIKKLMSLTNFENVIQTYGFLGAFFILTSFAGIYSLRRLLNKDDGILTLLAKKHIIFIDKTLETMDNMIKTQDKICEYITKKN